VQCLAFDIQKRQVKSKKITPLELADFFQLQQIERNEKMRDVAMKN